MHEPPRCQSCPLCQGSLHPNPAPPSLQCAPDPSPKLGFTFTQSPPCSTVGKKSKRFLCSPSCVIQAPSRPVGPLWLDARHLIPALHSGTNSQASSMHTKEMEQLVFMKPLPRLSILSNLRKLSLVRPMVHSTNTGTHCTPDTVL